MSVICLGQGSIQVGLEVEKIASRFNVSHNRILLVDNGLHSENKTILHLCRCSSHIVFNNSDGCRFCMANVQSLLYQLSALFNETDCTQPSIVVADMSSAFGVWSLRIVLRYIEHHFPLMNIYCVLRKPSNVKIQGIEHFYSVLNIQVALEYCTNVFIRGHLASTEVDADTMDSSLPSLIACDVFTLLMMTAWSKQHRLGSVMLRTEEITVNNCSYCPELALCCNGQQIIDLRSSCQRVMKVLFTIKSKNSATSAKLADYNALRSCISSIHHTHLSYATEYPDYALWGTGANPLKDNEAVSSSGSGDSSAKQKARKRVVYGPNFVNLIVRRADEEAAISHSYSIDTRLTEMLSSEAITASQLTALNSATPNIKWVLNSNEKDRIGWRSNVQGDTMTVDSSSSSNSVMSVLTSNTRVTTATNAATRVDGIASSHNSQRSATTALCAVVFESLYAKHDVRVICERTKTLVSLGAYTHLFDGGSVSVLNILDAIQFIENCTFA